jgi:hypothetical protein
MIGNILTKLSPTSLVGYILALGLAYHIFIRARYEYRFRRAGGVNAPKIANNPFTGMPLTQTRHLVAKLRRCFMALDSWKSSGEQPNQRIVC